MHDASLPLQHVHGDDTWASASGQTQAKGTAMFDGSDQSAKNPLGLLPMTVSVTRHNAIAHVLIDNPPVNALSAAVRRGLMDAVTQTEADTNVRAVVVFCAGRTFVAGADVSEFDKPPLAPHLPDVIDAIETARKPWVAALHGTVLGGGLELAMGCYARVAAPKTKLGLPEVTLGLIPGSGGTVRLPRLIAPEKALMMIAGGKPITAAEALKAGLIDAIAPEDLLAQANARALATITPTPTLQRSVRRCCAAAFDKSRAKLLGKARGQTSIPAAVAAVERALKLPVEAAKAAERTAFLNLKSSTQCAALRHIFFAERRTLKDPRTKASARRLNHIGVVGGGTMGAGIATATLLRGYKVTLVEQTQDGAERAQQTVFGSLEKPAQRGLIESPDATMAAFTPASTYTALSQADLVIEAVFEDMEVKKDVFRQLESVTRPDAILATNTSYLDVNEIAGVLRDPSRVVGLHFFSPAHIMKLLEIVLPDSVAEDVVASAASFSKSLDKIGVFAGVCDGFIGNRIMSAYRQEADFLIEDGASPSAVDSAMREFGFAMGIFEMQDLAGLDIAWAMRKRRAQTRPTSERYVRIADQLCAAGRFGRKTGAGWYDYTDAGRTPSDHVARVILQERAAKGVTSRDFSGDEIMDRILTRLRSEAHSLICEGIARRADDVDVVLVNGYGFPRWRGGPLFDFDGKE